MKLHHRRKFLHLAAASALPTLSGVASAQAYPARLIRLIAPFPAGGVVDLFSRLIAQSLSERVGQPVVVENRAGAGGNLGTEAAVRALPDGYTLLLMTSTNAINQTLYDKLNFDFVQHCPDRQHQSRSWRAGSAPRVSRQDGARIHRLPQSQSRQGQHGVGRHWNFATHLWRVVQDDGGRQHGARPLSGWRPGADGPAGRANPRHVRYDRD